MMTDPYVNSSHTGASARTTTGEVYRPRPASTGICNTMSCIRCGSIRPLSALVADARIKHQRRCAGGCNSGAAR